MQLISTMLQACNAPCLMCQWLSWEQVDKLWGQETNM